MKNIFLIMCLIAFGTSSVLAQKKDVYQIKYIGKISSKQLTVKEIKLPTTLYFHGLQDKESMVFYTTTPQNKTIELLCSSHLVDLKTIDFEELKKLYQSKTTSLPIELVVVDNQNWERTKKVYLSWENIKFIKPTNGVVYTLIIDLGTIEL